MDAYPIKNTTFYSDGTETTVHYVPNPEAEHIEEVVAEATEETSPEEPESIFDEVKEEKIDQELLEEAE